MQNSTIKMTNFQLLVFIVLITSTALFIDSVYEYTKTNFEECKEYKVDDKYFLNNKPYVKINNREYQVAENTYEFVSPIDSSITICQDIHTKSQKRILIKLITDFVLIILSLMLLSKYIKKRFFKTKQKD